MPPKPGISLLKRTPKLEDTFFLCPSCSQFRPSPRRTTAPPLLTSIHRSRNTTLRHSSSTANAPRSVANGSNNIPERFRDLYEALNGVRHAAGDHVNLNRLQLAQRGLESEKPVIRVAVFGLGDTKTAVKIVRLLLADPLSAKADWEDRLSSYGTDGLRGLLIRYGEEVEITSTDGLVPTVSVPSEVLKNGNVEILVSSLAADSATSNGSISDSLQVPEISIPSTNTGSRTSIQYPVHKSIICGSGVGDLLAYSRLIGQSKAEDREPARAVFELNLRQIPENQKDVSFVDIERAELALEKFRQSAQNATEYQDGWTGSGIQPLAKWLSDTTKDTSMHTELRKLLKSVLNEADKSITRKENRILKEQEAKSVPEEVRESLSVTVSTWAERGHTELRNSLDEAFGCKQWKNLVWWKLFWRVDDIAMLCSSMVEKQWLVRAEKEGLWIGGRFQQARLLNRTDSTSNPEPSIPAVDKDGEPKSESSSDSSNPSWPTQITETRNQVIGSTVPSLHALAQRLVMFSISTTSLTSVLSALTYISTSSTSVYEAGTIAAVGLIYSIRRQQKKWDAARKFWESEVREEGRKALKGTEDAMRVVLQEGGRPPKSAVEPEAESNVEKAKKALSNVP